MLVSQMNVVSKGTESMLHELFRFVRPRPDGAFEGQRSTCQHGTLQSQMCDNVDEVNLHDTAFRVLFSGSDFLSTFSRGLGNIKYRKERCDDSEHDFHREMLSGAQPEVLR